MTQAERFVRRNRVNERNAAAIGLASGIVALLRRRRTDGLHGDRLAAGRALGRRGRVGVGLGAVVGARRRRGRRRRDRIPTDCSRSSPQLRSSPGCSIGVRRRDQAELRAVVAGVALNVLIRSELDGFFGLSAIIGVSIGVALFVVGVLRRPSAIRRPAWIAAAGVAGVAVLGLFGLVGRRRLGPTRPLAWRSTGTSGDHHAELRRLSGAAALFADSSTAFGRADDRLGGVLALPSRLIPGISQNVTAGADLADAAAAGTADAASGAAIGRPVDPPRRRRSDRPRGGRRCRAAARRRATAPWSICARCPTPWTRRGSSGRCRTNWSSSTNASTTTSPASPTPSTRCVSPRRCSAPIGERRYLILFTTPVELRGIAGFIGNYAEITVDDGKIEVTEFGRRSDLGAYLAENPGNCDACPPEMLDRYGNFGLTNGPDGGVLPNVWQNLPMPAHFPYTAEAAQVLYPQSGGDPIDGVISLDPYVVAALMAYTGPIEVPELGVTVSPDNAAEFILRDQYLLVDQGDGEIDNDSRIDALETLGEGVVEPLLTGSLPEPSELARDLGPLVAEHRLMMWTDDPGEQELLNDVGMLGALPELGPDGGFSVIVANGGQSKIDAFLERTTDVRIETAPDGSRELVADVTLRNGAPATGLPRYVIGNGYGLPDGASRLIVNFFGPEILTSLTIDGQVLSNFAQPEAGWTGYRTDVVLLAGESATYEARFALDPVEPGEPSGEPVEWVQPLAIPSR